MGARVSRNGGIIPPLPDARTRKLFWANAIVCFLLLSQPVAAVDLWIDTDVTLASPFREPDDAFALLLALHSRDLRVVGISTTYGNGPLPLVQRSARDLIARFGRAGGITEAKLHAGARSPAGLGSRTAATDALVRQLRERNLTVLALGPLTNLATLVMFYPELARRIDRIVFVGGQLAPGEAGLGFIRLHDANTIKDPAAAEVILRSRIPLTVIPVDVAARLALSRHDLDRLGAVGAGGEYLTRKTQLWSRFFTHVVRRDAPIFDALATVAAGRPRLLHFEDRRAVVDREGMSFQPTESKTGVPVRVCTGMKPGAKGFVLERLRSR